jgi:hypothetical protein
MSARLALIMLMLAATAVAMSQPSRLGDSCDLSVVGAKDSAAFLDFDRELRSALAHQDALAFSFAVNFPLKINTDRSKFSLDDPAALQMQFQQVLPAAMRSALLAKPASDLSCTADGVMYGNGEMWVEFTSQGYRVKVINLSPPSTGNNDLHSSGKIEFLCRTEKYRIAIDSDSAQTSRYRSWNQPRPIDSKPDLELKAGTLQYEGHGSCAYPTWTFKNADTTYEVEGLGCTSDSDPPPVGVVGHFEVTIGGKSRASGWCY